jgi:hypothetical protein
MLCESTTQKLYLAKVNLLNAEDAKVLGGARLTPSGGEVYAHSTDSSGG